MMTQRRIFYELMPSWLSSGEGELHQYALGIVRDAANERARQAAHCRFPETGPNDALSYQQRDRLIVRGIDETRESYAARLVQWLNDHRKRGNPFELMHQLRGYCNCDVRIRTVDRRGNWFTRERDGTESFALDTGAWDWDAVPASPDWARFWVIIYPTTDPLPQPWQATRTWGMGYRWGDGRTWGTTATPEQVSMVRSIVKLWRPEGTRCEWIIIAFDDTSFDPMAPEPDGDWDLWSVGDPRLKNRLVTARYWKGTGP